MVDNARLCRSHTSCAHSLAHIRETKKYRVTPYRKYTNALSTEGAWSSMTQEVCRLGKWKGNCKVWVRNVVARHERSLSSCVEQEFLSFVIKCILQVSMNHQTGVFLLFWFQIAGIKIYILNERK